MKRISLTQTEIAALETALIQFGAIITFDQLSTLLNDDRKYLIKRISKLTYQGWLQLQYQRIIYTIINGNFITMNTSANIPEIKLTRKQL